jgi:hypothetical protein
MGDEGINVNRTLDRMSAYALRSGRSRFFAKKKTSDGIFQTRLRAGIHIPHTWYWLKTNNFPIGMHKHMNISVLVLIGFSHIHVPHVDLIKTFPTPHLTISRLVRRDHTYIYSCDSDSRQDCSHSFYEYMGLHSSTSLARGNHIKLKSRASQTQQRNTQHAQDAQTASCATHAMYRSTMYVCVMHCSQRCVHSTFSPPITVMYVLLIVECNHLVTTNEEGHYLHHRHVINPTHSLILSAILNKALRSIPTLFSDQ